MHQENVLDLQISVDLSAQRLEGRPEQSKQERCQYLEELETHAVNWYAPLYHPTSGSEWNWLVIWGIAVLNIL